MNLNPLLYQVIASRMAANGNHAMADTLARLAQGSADSAQGTTQELLAQMANSSDPTVSLIAKHLADYSRTEDLARKQPPVVDLEPPRLRETSQNENEPDAGDLRSEELSEALVELRQQCQSMFAELKGLRTRSSHLAAALGACPLCWGKNAECESCRGRGRPGFSIPDRHLFSEFVLPAVRLLRAHEAKNSSSSGKHTAKNGKPSARLNESANQNERKDL